MMTGDQIRQSYLDFFAERGHLILPGASLVPENDPGLLWINAGMAPFKRYFSGELTPPEKRIATSQKCIRTNDIENVGKTDRHQTFFEMLGNFSFGDYFKKEAISWAWEYVCDVLQLEKDRLWVTIYRKDEEAFNIWHKHVGLARDRIIRMGKDENYWQIGTGPCGPCSEIHYDRGEEYGNSCEDVIGGEGDRYLEIWNLVFTQYDYTEDGQYLPLPDKNIDTGMGLERVASILQGTDSNFETDLIKPIIDDVVQKSGIPYQKDEETIRAYRVIADHARTVTMAINDGVLPANEGRGYVIRRLLRRAVRYGNRLNFQKPFLYKLIPVVNQVMSGGYPELEENTGHVEKVVKTEEERFLKTLDQGLEILQGMIDEIKAADQKILSGKKVFKLYDTFGFPPDLTAEILQEEGLDIDQEGFASSMQKQKQRAREAREQFGFDRDKASMVYDRISQQQDETEFCGYSTLQTEAVIEALVKEGSRIKELSQGEQGELILDRTSFYAESGGQVGDKGIIKSSSGRAKVIDTYRKSGLIIKQIKVLQGSLARGEKVQVEVDEERRQQTAANHSATHLLHQALKETLGEHIKQSGSLVSPDRLRFDFTHYSALQPADIDLIEEKVNKNIRRNHLVETIITDMEEAKKMDAVALFGEKYGEEVRVVKTGDYSLELCGGTHVSRTGEIGLFKITAENSVAAGIRRIEAVTGKNALHYVKNLESILTEAAGRFNSVKDELVVNIDRLLQENKELEKNINSLKDRLSGFRSEALLENVEEVGGVSLITAKVEGLDNQALRKLGDQLQQKMDSGIIVLASRLVDKVIFVAMVSQDLVDEGYHAGKIVARISKITGGGGGGRPDMAQAGGSRPDKIDLALNEVKQILAD